MLAADDHTFAILENKLNVRTRGNFDCLLKVYEYLQEEIHKEKSQAIDTNLMRTKRHAQEVRKRQLITGIQLEKERLLFTIEDMQTRSSNFVNDTLGAQARINTYLHNYEMSLVHQKTKWMLRVPTFTTRIMDDIVDQGDETSLEYRAKERENTAIYFCQHNHREILCGSPIIFDEEKLRAELLETESATLRYHAMELLCLYTQTLSSNWESGKFNLAQRLDPLFLHYLPFTMFATLSHLAKTENLNNQQFADEALVLLPILLRACECYLELSHRLLSPRKTRVLVVDGDTLLHKLKELRKDPHKLSNNSSNSDSRPSSRIGKKNEGKESIHDLFRSILCFHFTHSTHGMLSFTASLTQLCDLFSNRSHSSSVVTLLKSVALCRTTITSSLLRVALFTLSLHQTLPIIDSPAKAPAEVAQLSQAAIRLAAIASNKCRAVMGVPGHFGVMVIPEPLQLSLLIDVDLCAAMDLVTHYLSSYASYEEEERKEKQKELEKQQEKGKLAPATSKSSKSPSALTTSTSRKVDKVESKLPKSELKVAEKISEEKFYFSPIHSLNLEMIVEVLSTAKNATFHRGMSPFVITAFLHLILATSTFLIDHAKKLTKNEEKGDTENEEILEENVEKCRGILSSMIERVMAVSIWHKQSVSIIRLAMLCLRYSMSNRSVIDLVVIVAAVSSLVSLPRYHHYELCHRGSSLPFFSLPNYRLLLRELFIGRMSLEDGLSRNLLPLLDICYDGKPLLSLAPVNDDDDDDDNNNHDARAHRAAVSSAPHAVAVDSNRNTRLETEPSSSLLEDSLSWMSSEEASPAHSTSSHPNSHDGSPVPFFPSNHASISNSPLLPPTGRKKSTAASSSDHDPGENDDDSVVDAAVETSLHKLRTEAIPRILRHYMQQGVSNDFVRLPGVNSVTVNAAGNGNRTAIRKKGQGLEEASITSVELIATNDPLVPPSSEQPRAPDKSSKTSLADLVSYCAETHIGHSETFEQVLLLIEHIAAKSQLCKYVLSEAGLPLVLQRYLESRPKSVYLVALASLCAEALEIK